MCFYSSFIPYWVSMSPTQKHYLWDFFLIFLQTIIRNLVKQTDNLSTKVLFKTLYFCHTIMNQNINLKISQTPPQNISWILTTKIKTMKKNLSISFLLFIILSITACGKSDESSISEQTENRNENNDKTDAPISGKNWHNLVL